LLLPVKSNQQERKTMAVQFAATDFFASLICIALPLAVAVLVAYRPK
jgi:hypothetical protein